MVRPIRFVALVLLSLPCLLAAQHVDTLDANRWRFPLTDYGPFGSGASWRDTSHMYLFGCGPWFGAVVGSDTLVSFGYNTNSGGTEFRTGDSQEDSLSMVYIWPDRWPAPQSRFPHAPQVRRSDQDAWCCFNDFDSTGHIPPGRPLPLQVYMTAYEWCGPRAQDLVILQYEFECPSESTLSTACYAGVALDPDVGDGVDYFGAIYHQWLHRSPSDSFYVDNVAYVYDSDNYVPGWDSVGCVGVAFIKTPGNLGATAIKVFTIEFDPVTDAQQYLTMAGYDYRNGVYDPIDSVDMEPSDKRFLVAAGPFTLGFSGQSIETLVVVIGATTQWPGLLGIGEIGIIGDSLYRYGVPGIAAETRPTTPAAGLKAWSNPFGSAVWFTLAGPTTRGEVAVRDVSGRLVRTLAVKGRGRWIGDDSRGSQVAPGVYFVSFGDERLKVVRR